MSATQDDLKPDISGENLPKVPFWKKVTSNITVEPVVICWLLPFLLTYASIENLVLEKSCRGFVLETAITPDVCQIFVRKDAFGIACNGSTAPLEGIEKEEIERRYPETFANIKDNFQAAIDMTCDVEERVQNKVASMNSIRNPISAIGPLIIILFAGPWSDKKNKRIPCMLVPFLGEAIGYWSENVVKKRVLQVRHLTLDIFRFVHLLDLYQRASRVSRVSVPIAAFSDRR